MRTILCAMAILACGAASWADEEKIALDKLPKAVAESVKKRFPKGEMSAAVKETEDKKTTYEVTLKDGSNTVDINLNEDGTITGMEKEIDVKDLPKVVSEAVSAKYPKAKMKKAEEVIKVKEGKENLEYYEVYVVVDDKDVEVEVLPDGKLKPMDEKKDTDDEWTSDFSADKDSLTSTGKNPYFILEPGYQTTYADDDEKVVKTVLNETKIVDGVECRVVEERETKKGKLVELSRNYFAISKRTNSVYYFGEDVDEYEDGKVTGHKGSWLSGKDGAKFGLMMPGVPLIKSRFYQEVAPKVAQDRAEIIGLDVTIQTPAGEFKKCVKMVETTPLEPKTKEYKVYAPGIGLVQDGDLKLIKYGKVELPKK